MALLEAPTAPTESADQPRQWHYRRAGFLAGLIAGTALTLATFLLARLFGLFSLPELVGYRLIALLPLSLFSWGVETFGGAAKQLLLIGATVGQIVVSGLLGLLFATCATPLPGEQRPGRRAPTLWNATLPGALIFATFLFVLVEVVILPIVDGGPLGVFLPAGLGATALGVAAEAALFSIVLVYLYRLLLSPAPVTERSGEPLTRRQLITRIIFGAAALVVGAGAVVNLRTNGDDQTAPPQASGRVGNGGLPPEVTPTDDFYTVSKNFVDPKVSEAGWKVQIGGMVDRPYSLTLDDIRAMPPVSDYRTLCCISNEVGGDLISNASWKGVRLKDLLERAGVKSGAVDLVIGAADGYTDSFPIAKALTPEVLAVYEMNGASLNDKHGFPLRLLVPDIYGMKNVKWVTRLDVVGSNYIGYWQERGWNDTATIKTMSRIDFPRHRQLLPPGPTQIGGVAFAGARGVSKVEASSDGGKRWVEGQIRRPLGPATWVLWTADLTLGEGEQTLVVRATDGAGQLQTDEIAPPAPDGSSGWHSIVVRTSPGAPVPPTRASGGESPTPARNQGIYTP